MSEKNLSDLQSQHSNYFTRCEHRKVSHIGEPLCRFYEGTLQRCGPDKCPCDVGRSSAPRRVVQSKPVRLGFPGPRCQYCRIGSKGQLFCAYHRGENLRQCSVTACPLREGI